MEDGKWKRLWNSHREGIQEDSGEEQNEEEDDEQENDPLEASPYDVLHGLIWRREPQE